MAKMFDTFVDPAERGVAQIGAKKGNLMFTGMVDKEYCLLSDRRLYYKGVSYGIGNLGGKAKSEIVIHLPSITSTAFCVVKHVGLLLLSILFLIAGVTGAALMREDPKIPLIAGGVLFVVFLLLYIFVRKRLMQIDYSGGSLKLQCWGQPEKNMRAFCNAIHATADQRRAEAQEVEIREPVPMFQVMLAESAPAPASEPEAVPATE